MLAVPFSVSATLLVVGYLIVSGAFMYETYYPRPQDQFGIPLPSPTHNRVMGVCMSGAALSLFALMLMTLDMVL